MEVGGFDVAGDAGGGVGEELHLLGGLAGALGELGHVEALGEMGLELGQDRAGAVDDLLGHAREARHVDAVALVRAARECIAMKPEPDRWIFTDHEAED